MKSSIGELVDVPLKRLEQNDNLRELAEDDALKELAESIKIHGVLEPVLVEAKDHNGTYRLISGYRRCAAAKRAGLIAVPAIVQLDSHVGFSQNGKREIQLVENVQRKDLSPLEEAKAFRAIVDSGVTQAELAKRVGKSQPYVANRIRLLGLPDKAQELLGKGRIGASDADKILSIPAGAKGARESVAAKIASLRLSSDPEFRSRDISYVVDRAMDGVRKRQELEQARSNAKFPSCPVKDCGKMGTRIPWDSSRHFGPGQKGVGVSKLGCSKGHEWSTSTGKVEAHHSYNTNEPVGRAERPKPTLPEVNPIINEAPPASSLGPRLYNAIEKIEFVALEWDGKRAEIRFGIVPGKALQRLPSFSTSASTRTSSVLKVDAIQSWEQLDDAGRKRCAEYRAALETWLATFGTPGRKPANSAPNKGADA